MSITYKRLTPLLALLGALLGSNLLSAGEKESGDFFESKVRPILAANCFSCHGPREQKSKLRLDQRSHFFKGGEGGAIVVPGMPGDSELIAAIKYESYEMPPSKQLSSEQISILETWVSNGAYWPEHPEGAREDDVFTQEDRDWWAFQPVLRPPPPKVVSGALVQNPIDNFVQAKLAAEGLVMAPPTADRELIRRIYFDMLGVPPTPEEISEFVNNTSPDAYEQLVDAILADPRYGQRWATHWLDLVRYADSDGYRQDAFRPNAWRYRDYVIRSFNDDKSYRQFMQEQLAGDEIAPDDPDALIATYFLRGGVYEWNSRDAEGQQVLLADELTDTVGDVFLGMGIACAHCHNHKFDPILHDDYYRLQAFFKPLVWKDDYPLCGEQELKEYEAKLAQWEAKHQDLLDQIANIEARPREKVERKAVEMFPSEVQAIYWKPAEERNAYENQIYYLVYDQVKFEYGRLSGAIPKDDKQKWEELKKQVQAFLKSKPTAPPMASIATDARGEIPPTIKPDDHDKREIKPGFLTILHPEPAQIDPASLPAASTSGRRATLAKWLSRDDNPLVPRVIVNRIWQYHFGAGISSSASDFGRLGEPPSHPELLDWLTSQFIENGWRLKPLHREILLSAAYQQSSLIDVPEKAKLVDPKNRLLWRFPSHRLKAEQIRDAMLAASGELSDKPGGPPASSNSPVRSVYTKKMRNSPDALLDSFDAPSGFSSVALRNSTTTATQSLLMINGDWTLKRAEAMAKRLKQQYITDYAAMVRDSYQVCFGRPPRTEELEAAVAFIEDQVVTNRDLSNAKYEQLPSTVLLDEPQMQRWSTAFNISDKTPHQLLTLPDNRVLPARNFTIEAIVFNRTLFPGATVRTIAAQWNGALTTPGWNFGITSEQSAYRPRNLVLQLIGDDKEGKVKYEVVPSNLRIPADKPYYVAAAVDFDAGTATFYARDMSYDESELETVVVKHSIVGDCSSDSLRFSIGGRDAQGPHNWDGLIDDIRLTQKAILDESQLMINSPNDLTTDDTVAMWRFVRSDPHGPLSDTDGGKHELQLSNRSDRGDMNSILIALSDYCHVLLNSSEFQFID
ncbi:DUF1553 domain-containing protein [Blastopirellula sp. J2-11]|uniref:DUF1553 domain-containing protein n=1 Tax=Blastopirellula sp. J2-11 TaxID=2943192 RepID=UPI0021CA2694|nr:DUF1553 domain-containing protein [Blastopirellula sp. J2-11]UUO07766.1 DUF1553 domain-containing protein [Blastopirellula sp. J2-11]